MNPTLQQSASAMLKTGIWDDDEFVESHSIEDTYLLLYLLTSPDRHLSGIIKLNTRLVTARTKWERNQVHIVLERLQELGDVLLDGQFVWVKGYFDHNQTPAATHFKQIRERLSEVSVGLRKQWLLDAKERGISEELIGYPYPTDTLSIRYRHPTGTLPGNNNGNGTVIDNDNNNGNGTFIDNDNNNGNGTFIDNDNNNNNNEKRDGGCGGGVELIFPTDLHSEEAREIGTLIAGRADAQDLLDELAAGLARPNLDHKIKYPAHWVRSIVSEGQFSITPAGRAVAKARARQAMDKDTKILPPRDPAARQKFHQAFGESGGASQPSTAS